MFLGIGSVRGLSTRWTRLEGARLHPFPVVRLLSSSPSVDSIKILFGSQTGTATSYAQLLGKVAKKKKFSVSIVDLADYNHEQDFPKENYVVFIVSCFGEGEPTTSSKAFYDWLTHSEREKENNFSHLKYSIFGLGNSLYGGVRYQRVAKSIDERLSQLGAQRIGDLGLGDANVEMEENFDNWEENLWKVLNRQQQLHKSQEEQPEMLHLLSNPPEEVKYYKKFNPGVYSAGNPFLAGVIRTTLLSRNSERPSRHIELNLTNSGLTYESGDYVGVSPQNDRSLVTKLAHTLSLDLNQSFSIDPTNGTTILNKLPACFPNPATIEDVLLHYVDITGSPKRHFIKSLSDLAKDPLQKQTLQYFAESATNEAFSKEFHYKSFYDILEAYPSISFKDLGELLELLPPLLFRYYSIASSPQVFPNSIHITTILNKFPTSKYLQSGICSSYLERAREGNAMPIHIHPSTFKLPTNHKDVPILLVATGTGIAPMRAFLMDRELVGAKETILFFGNYHRKVDYLYEQELSAWTQKGVIKQLFTAFSHDQPELIFVTHLMIEQSALIWDYLYNKRGYLYVCGHQRLSTGVEDVLSKIFIQYKRMDYSSTDAVLEAAKDFVKELSMSGHLKQDVFA